MRKIGRILAALTFTAGTVLAAGASAQASETGALEQGPYAGCDEGYVCIYPNASWNGGSPEHRYYTYGVHTLYNEYGTHRVFNNQYGGATTRLCRNYNGTDCTSKIEPWSYRDIDLTPYNSIRLDPS